MTFIVEDGTGVVDANSYITLAFFKSYHDDRGTNYASYNDTLLQQGIIRATDYINRRFGDAFIGMRYYVQQALEWPRIDAFYRDGRYIAGVPIELQQATAEYAFRALTDSLAPDPAYSETNAAVIESDEQVGPIRERFAYGANGVVWSFRKYPLADSLLRELVYRGRELLRA